jgi:hypothetical protein
MPDTVFYVVALGLIKEIFRRTPSHSIKCGGMPARGYRGMKLKDPIPGVESGCAQHPHSRAA